MTHRQKCLLVFSVTCVIILAEFALSAFAFLLPAIKKSFMVSDLWLEHCFSYGVLALGLAGLAYGIMTDLLGRKPLFCAALMIFFVASYGLYWANSPQLLLIARIGQSIGAGAAWVVGNACLGDVFKGASYSRVMNQVHAVVGIVPALAPVLVTLFLRSYDWNALYLIMACCSLVLALLILINTKETLVLEKKQSWRVGINRLLTHQVFLGYTWVKAVTVGMMFTLIAQFPLICVERYSIVYDRLWVAMLPLFVGYIASSLLSAQLSRRYNPQYLMMIGLLALAIGSICVLLGENTCSFMLILAVVSILFIGFGFVFGNATAQIVSAIPAFSGLASAIMIAAEMLLSSLFVYGLAFFMDGSFFPVSIFLIVTTCLASIPFFSGVLTRHDLVEKNA